MIQISETGEVTLAIPIQKSIPISEIQTESGTQTRVMINEDVVAEYAEAMQAGAKFPPVVVFHDGTDYYLADGFHTTLAAVRNGLTEISADIRKGTRLDALTYALGANTTHGHRRNKDDKRRCVEIALREFGEWSDNRIAETCCVSDKTVASVRAEVRKSEPESAPPTRTGKDNKQYPAHKSSKPKPQEEPKPGTWIAPEVGTAKAAPEPSRDPKDYENTRTHVGMFHAENAIWQLEKIPANDTEFKNALNSVMQWIIDKLEQFENG